MQHKDQGETRRPPGWWLRSDVLMGKVCDPADYCILRDIENVRFSPGVRYCSGCSLLKVESFGSGPFCFRVVERLDCEFR